jgi:hypothetical protein
MVRLKPGLSPLNEFLGERWLPRSKADRNENPTQTARQINKSTIKRKVLKSPKRWVNHIMSNNKRLSAPAIAPKLIASVRH